jgi:hypothetical protein
MSGPVKQIKLVPIQSPALIIFPNYLQATNVVAATFPPQLSPRICINFKVKLADIWRRPKRPREAAFEDLIAKYIPGSSSINTHNT